MNYSLLRRLSAGAVCAALLATMTACGGGSSAPAADSADSSADGGTVKVGLLHSLTGSMAIRRNQQGRRRQRLPDCVRRGGRRIPAFHLCCQGRKADRQRWRSDHLRLLDLLLA